MSFDPVALMKYLEENKRPNRRNRFRQREHVPHDPYLSFYEMKRAADEWDKIQKDLEKLNKKEQKHGWEGLSFIQKLVILTGFVPFIVILQLCIPTIMLVKILGLHQ